MEEEIEALKQYGVNIKPDHAECYKYHTDVNWDFHEQIKPWEVPLHIQIGWDQVSYHRCDTAETWNNPGFLFEVRQGIAYCQFNEPENNNSFSPGISAGLNDACRIVRNRVDIRMAVLTGTGRMWSAGGDPRSFQAAQRTAGVIGPEATPSPPPSAQLEQHYDESKASPPPTVGRSTGHKEDAPDEQRDQKAQLEESYEEFGKTESHDLFGGPPGYAIVHNEHKTSGLQQNLQGAIQGAAMFYNWATIPCFSMACMNGSAMGGALGLLAGTDFVVAVKSAFNVLSEVRLGVIPAVVSPHVVRAIGTSNAKRIFSIAENLNTQKALEIGLIQRIVMKKDEFPAVVKEIAEKINAVAPEAVRASKAAIFACLNQPMSNKLMEFVSAAYVHSRLGAECEEGMRALAENRTMPWQEKPIDVKEDSL